MTFSRTTTRIAVFGIASIVSAAGMFSVASVCLLSSGCPELTQCIDSGFSCGVEWSWQVCQDLSAGGTCSERYFLLNTGRGATTTRVDCNGCDCNQAVVQVSNACLGLMGGLDASAQDAPNFTMDSD
jgi:hypothetical protein